MIQGYYRQALIWAGIFGVMAIVFGAFGAHTLKSRLSAESLLMFQTGIRYHAWHAIALFALGLAGNHLPYVKGITICWIIGIVLFSFSIYLLSTRGIMLSETSWLGPVTPVGGVFLIAGWMILIASALKLRSYNTDYLNDK